MWRFDSKRYIPEQRYRIFFPEKVGGSINQSNPKIVCFFFQKKSMRHSFRMWWVFLYFFWKWGVFFFLFPNLCVFLCVFFSCKSSHTIHSFDLEAVFFFRRWKKNTAFSFIQSILPQNVKKINFYRKKYDTFGIGMQKSCLHHIPWWLTLQKS